LLEGRRGQHAAARLPLVAPLKGCYRGRDRPNRNQIAIRRGSNAFSKTRRPSWLYSVHQRASYGRTPINIVPATQGACR
jgi:hypothetical protein